MGNKVLPFTISELNKKVYVHIEDWRAVLYRAAGIRTSMLIEFYLRRNWGGEHKNVAVLVVIAVNEDGYREVLSAAEGMKEDKTRRVSFFQWRKGRGLDSFKLIV